MSHDNKTKEKYVWKEIAYMFKKESFSFDKDVDSSEKVYQNRRNFGRVLTVRELLKKKKPK